MIKSCRRVPNRAKNSPDGLYRQTAAGLHVSRHALAAVAFPLATTTFQYAASPHPQLCALDSRFCHRSPGHAANPARGGDVGARAPHRFVKLAAATRLGRCDRHLSADGLRLLVVALGKSYAHSLLPLACTSSHDT